MTYLVFNLASCLFFAQVLGLLLGWLLWGYSATQRKKEIALLQKRMTDMSMQALKPLDEGAHRVGLPAIGLPAGRDHRKLDALLAGGPESLLADLPPLAPLPPDPDELAPLHAALQEKDGLLADFKAQVDGLHTQLATVESRRDMEVNELKSQLQSLTHELSASKSQVNPVERMLQAEVDQERAAHTVLSSELSAVKAERDRLASESKSLQTELEKSGDLQRKIAALTSESSFALADKEKVAADLRIAKADFEKRSSWLTKRIHELERSAEEWEKAKSDLKLAARETAKSRNNEVTELTELKQRLEQALHERDAMAAEIAGHKNGASQIPVHIAELQQSLLSKDSQLMEQVARGERLLWRVTELESFANRVPELEEVLRAKDAHIAELAGEASERDSHIRTLLRRMTDLEPLSLQTAELKSALKASEAELERHKLGQLQEFDQTQSRALEFADALRAKDAAQLEMHQKTEQLARQREADLQAFSARAADLESELRQKQAALTELTLAHAEKAAAIESLQAQVRELSPLPEQLQDLTNKHHSDLTRLKVSSAQRIRKLRQGITSFKS